MFIRLSGFLQRDSNRLLLFLLRYLQGGGGKVLEIIKCYVSLLLPQKWPCAGTFCTECRGTTMTLPVQHHQNPHGTDDCGLDLECDLNLDKSPPDSAVFLSVYFKLLCLQLTRARETASLQSNSSNLTD